MPVARTGEPLGDSARGTVWTELSAISAIAGGVVWLVGVVGYYHDPASVIWLIAPLAIGAAIVTSRFGIGRSSGFFGWIASLLSAGGILVAIAAWGGVAAGIHLDALGLSGLGMLFTSQPLFALGYPRNRSGSLIALLLIGIGWLLFQIAWLLALGPPALIPLGVGWVLFGLTARRPAPSGLKQSSEMKN